METKPAFSAAVVEVLKQDNYLDWSVRVKTYLMAQDLWDIVESRSGSPTPENEDIVESRSGSPTPENEAVFKVWSKTNAMALHVIQISCGPDTFSDIREISSARIAWKTLAGKYKPKVRDPSTEPGESDHAIEIYMDLYKALIIGDWRAADTFLSRNLNAIYARITVRGKTALHVAAEAGHVHIVEELVKQMSEENLEIRDDEGFTALARATYNGNYRMVECMLGKNENLIIIDSTFETIPVVLALHNEHLKLARYLYLLTPTEILRMEYETIGASVVCEAIYKNALDIALDLVNRIPNLVVAQDRFGVSPLFALAGTPDCFPSGDRLVFWKRWIYSGIHIPLGGPNNDIHLDVHQLAGNRSRCSGKKIIGSWIYSLGQLASKLRTLLGIEHLYEMKLAHFLSRELLSRMKDQILISNAQQRAILRTVILRAIKEGIFEFVFEIVRAEPQLVWIHDEKSTNIFSVAVQYRSAKIFSLIYGLDTKHVLASARDSFNNNSLLHMAGMSAPSTSLNDIPGAALQMQRELQWFKEVESIVPPRIHGQLNKEGLTPRELFTKNHKDMRKDGEQWMKDTATSCTVVGALIVTIMFAAIFTIPVLMFLGILTSRYAEEDFLESLPKKLIIGLFTLFFSIATMMTAFSAALFLMLHEQSWIFKPVICLASIPITLFVLMQFPLLVAMAISTYGPSIFDRKMKHLF